MVPFSTYISTNQANLKLKTWPEQLLGYFHGHLSNIDCLTARTACLVCFSSSVNGRSKRKRKRKEAY
jgi:hypothetical protein